ncbi:esterase E4-like [Bicyclus anynana]|uniref:Esterase E4-like n=1 Tax=Bicyclus anynana TaxID=110368 RepID=A0A6J1P452_BICAN|nr:esterase E4-like [Bicyclus anynana]
MFYSKIHNILVLAVVFIYVDRVRSDVIVETTSGKIEGIEVKSIIENERFFSFLGIPYAEPPIGKLRFQPPVPHTGWKDIYNAKKERKHCAQYFMPQRKVNRYGYCGDEDCLHLSIHTPKIPINQDIKMPVIVFLYNEQFRISHNASKEYGPDFFMKEDVIIVTINYRLGFLGFASFEDVVLPGNNGMRDVLLALKWLQQNVKYFAGDPSNITLMGNSGGAVIVDILLQTPKAEGLFSKAIMQSGSSWHPSYIDVNPKQRAQALAEILEIKAGTSEELISKLTDVNANRITEAELDLVHPDESMAIQREIVQFGPVVEIHHGHAILTKLPEDNSQKLSVPVMIGFNSREAIEINENYLHNPDYVRIVNRHFIMTFPRRVNYHFNINNEVYKEALKEIKTFYFDDGFIKEDKLGEFLNYIGDIVSFYPTDYTVRKYTNTSDTPVYYYMFDYSGKLNFRKITSINHARSIDGTWGASIGDELCYLFICKKWKKVYKQLLENDDSEEIKVLTMMIKMYTQFAKTGNPTPSESDFVWKSASKENRECLVISDKPKMKSNLYEDKVRFWDEFIEKYEKLAVNGVVGNKVTDEL